MKSSIVFDSFNYHLLRVLPMVNLQPGVRFYLFQCQSLALFNKQLVDQVFSEVAHVLRARQTVTKSQDRLAVVTFRPVGALERQYAEQHLNK